MRHPFAAVYIDRYWLLRENPGESLRVPADPADRIFMEGQKVFLEAVKGMKRMLDRACEQAGLHPSDLDLIIPHQANQRIINAVRQKYRVPEEKVFINIRKMGNTSSITIPVCLVKVLEPGLMCGGTDVAKSLGRTAPYRIGLTAFGGGFTFGGGVLEVW
jgi:3-oxoacyl-[acyl-carrier-protein] synthase III